MPMFALRFLTGFILCATAGAAELSPAPVAVSPERAAERAWLASLPAAPKPELTRHGFVAEELRRWKPRGTSQGVAVDAHFFYGIGNYVVGKYDKLTGERLAEWVGLRGGPTIHLNGGIVQDGQLVMAHSNFPQQPMASSVEYFDLATVQPVKSVSLGVRYGSLTWAEKKDGFWWACFAHYTDAAAGPDSWGDDGLLYTTGHDEKELYVLRLPKMGVALEYVTTIAVPFEGQSWAWDRSEKRVIYGINRSTGEVIVVRIPDLPEQLRQR